MFCQYPTGYAGPCGIWNCKKHEGKTKEVQPKVKAKKFRGDSIWQRENGYGESKEGSNA